MIFFIDNSFLLLYFNKVSLLLTKKMFFSYLFANLCFYWCCFPCIDYLFPKILDLKPYFPFGVFKNKITYLDKKNNFIVILPLLAYSLNSRGRLSFVFIFSLILFYLSSRLLLKIKGSFLGKYEQSIVLYWNFIVEIWFSQLL